MRSLKLFQKKSQLRQSIQLSYCNAAIWSIGNGLTSASLIIYLALELMSQEAKDQWWSISLLLAAPSLLGILRWFAPTLIGTLGSRKTFCICSFIISGLLLLLLPWLCVPGRLPSLQYSLLSVVILWCVYHLFEYLGVIALWSWLGDLVPSKIRGRFIGRRERWLMIGRIIGMMAAGYYMIYWRQIPSKPDLWIGYANVAIIGAVLMLLAVVPLFLMSAINQQKLFKPKELFKKIFSPLQDRSFRRLLYFGCCFSLCNGISQAAQNIYHWQVLSMSLLVVLYMKIYMRLGQTLLSARVGKLVDRFGNRPIMILAQLFVATGPLFYYFATAQMPWILWGAWTVWIAYVGLNIALPNILLKLSPQQNNTATISTYFAITGVFYALSTILGGYLYHLLQSEPWQETIKQLPLVNDHFELIFLIGCAARLMAVLFLLRIIEPGAVGLKEIFQHKQKKM